jgi:hypothetical protein
MKKLPPRPEPATFIEDYDDGDPYSCMAAGFAEVGMQKTFTKRVKACMGKPDLDLHKLCLENRKAVKFALYELWLEADDPAVRSWTAEEMAKLGDKSLLDYDRE